MKKITKLILPVAGIGKRMRPLTLRIPKALVPLNGKPLLDYILEEALESGIRDVVLVMSPRHTDHFARYLKSRKKEFGNLKFYFRFQERPVGNGHAILQAADVIGKDAFAVRFCDDVIVAKTPVLASLIRLYETYRAPVLLLERVPKNKVSRYGVVGIKKVSKRSGKLPSGNIYRVTEIVEKPKARLAPSNLIIIGGYVLTPSILRNLKKISDSLPVAGFDALPLAVALQVEFIIGGRVYGWEFQGKRLDCGTVESLDRAEEFLRKVRR